MLSALRRWWPLVLITAAALWLRTHDLARRPMHADEANQAVKLGELLETGRYAFDPRDHHGPTLYYFALPIAWLRGEHTLPQLSETTVRLVPALFGTAAVMLLAVLAQPLGRWPAFAAAAFFALSPPAVYYARYFIQETLLLTFTLAAIACACGWWHRRTRGWAIATGVMLGLMQATKASAPLFALAAIVSAWLVVGPALRAGLSSMPQFAAEPRPPRRASPTLRSTLLWCIAAALLTAAVFYSSFGTHLGGLRDALAVYAPALARASGGDASGHEKPWWYYLALFGWQRNGGLLWHQLAFSALALAGAIVALFRREPLPRAALVFGAIVLLALSATPYKTPWHAIHLVPPFAVLAATALAALARLRTGKFVALATSALVAGTLFQQTARAAFLRPADARNPWAYVHSSADVVKFRALAEAALARSPGAPIRVIGEEYWPLPWYLRGQPRIGYWNTPPADCDGALVIATAAQADAVRARLHGAYRETYLGLRPGVLCVVFTPEI